MRPSPNRRGAHILGLALAVALGALSPASAETIRVVFVDSRVLTATEVTAVDASTLRITLADGARMAIPRARVARWEALPDDPESDDEPARANPRRGAAEAAAGGAIRPWHRRAGEWAPTFARAARTHGLDPELLLAVALTESALDPRARSPKGALGMMQLMPATANRLEVADPFDPRQNIDAGARWLRRLLDRYRGDLDLALAAYNAGEGAVERHGGVPPYPETEQYIQRVRRHVARLRGDS